MIYPKLRDLIAKCCMAFSDISDMEFFRTPTNHKTRDKTRDVMIQYFDGQTRTDSMSTLFLRWLDYRLASALGDTSDGIAKRKLIALVAVSNYLKLIVCRPCILGDINSSQERCFVLSSYVSHGGGVTLVFFRQNPRC